MTAKILKKDPGADPKKLNNREKKVAIGALIMRYSLHELFKCLLMPKSSYFYHRALLATPDKYLELESLYALPSLYPMAVTATGGFTPR